MQPDNSTSALGERPLRIAMLAYRGKPHVGGQGVYVREMSKALVELGHTVEVFGGPPYPDLDPRVPLHQFPSLEIYNDAYPGRIPGFWEIKDLPDALELGSFMTGNFSEPLSFSMRAYRALAARQGDFDMVIDNGSLGYGDLLIQKKLGLPILGIIHHPITVDRRLELDNARTLLEKFGKRRWYAFTRMQTRVCQQITRFVTVSESSKRDITTDHKVDIDKIHIVPIGIDTDFFAPKPDIERVPGRLVSTASADVPLKGQKFLLEALAKVRTEYPEAHLELVGRQRDGSTTADTLDRLDLNDVVNFNHGISYEALVELLASGTAAIVPSLYEGFSIPAIEALSCGAPLIATTGGALPEVAGPHLETCLACPPGDSDALAAQIKFAFDNPDVCERIAAAGRERVIRKWSWRESGITTADHCREVIAEWNAPEGHVMLTVDYDRLELKPGHRVLDLGCGFGRHAYEALRRGAEVVACDMAVPELREVRATYGAMIVADELPADVGAHASAGDATRLPFPDNTFDRIIASEVLEHVPDDSAALAELMRVLKPGGILAATVPSFLPERICWALSDEYHAPTEVGGHVRIYTRTELEAKMQMAGMAPIDYHRAHALHSPYWWLKCAVGTKNDDNPLVKQYLKFLTWDIVEQPAVTRLAEKVLSPVLGKSAIIYARKPATVTATEGHLNAAA